MRMATLACMFSLAWACSGARAAELPLPPTAPDSAGFSGERLARIDAFFAREIDANRVPGAVVGIARDGRLVYLKAFGYQDKARGLPMQVDTIFQLASMTKPMVAVAALTLTEQGRLPLFSPLASYFPGFAAMQVAAAKPDGTLGFHRMWECKEKHPKREFSAKVGTIFEDSPLRLEKWFSAIWMIANCKNGVSSYEIHRAIGVTQKTAWFMLHRIRLAMETGSF